MEETKYRLKIKAMSNLTEAALYALVDLWYFLTYKEDRKGQLLEALEVEEFVTMIRDHAYYLFSADDHKIMDQQGQLTKQEERSNQDARDTRSNEKNKIN